MDPNNPLNLPVDELTQAVAVSLLAVPVMFAVSPLLGKYLDKAVTGRRGTFVLIVLTLYFGFMVCYYGFPFMSYFVWDLHETLWPSTITGIGMLLGLLWVLIPIIPLHYLVNETKSPLEVEFENLSEEEMSPMDLKRKAYLEKKRQRAIKRGERPS